MRFKWNEVQHITLWSCESDSEYNMNSTNKGILFNPNLIRYEHIGKAISSVVDELIELGEPKGLKTLLPDLNSKTNAYIYKYYDLKIEEEYHYRQIYERELFKIIDLIKELVDRYDR